MFENFLAPLLGTCVTNAGSSDWASQEIPIGINQIWYQLKRLTAIVCFMCHWTAKNLKQVRMFHLLNDCPEVKIGAYACSPQRDDFEAILSQIDFE